MSEVQGETMQAALDWQLVAPLVMAEGSRFALWFQGQGQILEQEAEDAMAIAELVAEILGHHLAVQQAAEYSGLLNVFGHHVGTLFKASGALELYSSSQDAGVRRVIERVLPVWGVSQAISLHKKEGEAAWEALIKQWVEPGIPQEPDLGLAVKALVGFVYGSGEEPPFLPWTFAGVPVEGSSLVSLPPLRDQPLLFDKTLAFCVGLLELLANLRRYPEARGAGREDRRQLSQIDESEREVRFEVKFFEGSLRLEVEQPLVTKPDGNLPRSASLQRIQALESRLLRSLVETGPLQWSGPTSSPVVVRTRQTWTYHWRRLCLVD